MLGDICSRLRGLDRFSTLRFPLEQVVLAAVYRLAHVVTVRPLAEHCDMSTGAVVSLTRAVWEAIVHVYWDEMVGGLRPTTETARMAAAAEFEEISGIPNCIGLCDGSGHHIVFPNVDDAAARESYRYFKTSKPQIRFFATCDAKRRIYDVFYGAPGRTSDAEMLGRTTVSHRCSSTPTQAGGCQQLATLLRVGRRISSLMCLRADGKRRRHGRLVGVIPRLKLPSRTRYTNNVVAVRLEWCKMVRAQGTCKHQRQEGAQRLDAQGAARAQHQHTLYCFSMLFSLLINASAACLSSHSASAAVCSSSGDENVLAAAKPRWERRSAWPEAVRRIK